MRRIDLGVVVAFGQIIKPHVLAEIPMVNLHFSLLPRWRGAAPVERALLAGDEVTGVCLMAIEEGLDTGGVYERVEVPIGPRATADELRAELVDVGTALLVRRLRDGLGEPEPQHGEPIVRGEDPSGGAAPRLVAARRSSSIGWCASVAPGPRCAASGSRCSIGELVGTEPGDVLDGDVVGGLRLQVVQPEGKAPMAFTDFARGARPAPGERLGA